MISSPDEARRALMNWEKEKTLLSVAISVPGLGLSAKASVKNISNDNLELTDAASGLRLTLSLADARLERLKVVTRGSSVSVKLRHVEVLLAELDG